MDKGGPPNSSLSWMLYNKSLVGGNDFGMCGVRGRIFHELEVVFNALVLLCLRGTETLMHSSFFPVESRARSIVFSPEPATIRCMRSEMYVCMICVYDNSNRPRTNPPIQSDDVLGAWRTLK